MVEMVNTYCLCVGKKEKESEPKEPPVYYNRESNIMHRILAMVETAIRKGADVIVLHRELDY